MTDFKAFLAKLHQNLNILKEREAKYGGNAPLDLLNQISDHQEAIALTKQVSSEAISESEWREKLRPLLVAIDSRSDEAASSVTLGDVYGGIHGSIIAGRDIKIVTHVVQREYLKATILILAALAVVATAWFYLGYVAQKPARMTGDFNIAVTQFGEVTDQGIVQSARATQISSLLADFLDSEYKATDFGLNIQVAHNKIGIITEDREAEQLADEINADIVIYGRVFVSGDDAVFSPRFYVAGKPDTAELTGQHRLALPIRFSVSSLDSLDALTFEMRSRATILVSFTEGFAYLSAADIDGAAHSFQKAIGEAERYGQFGGQEVLYLFAALTARLQKNFEQSAEYLDQALTLNPEYARAYIGRGNIYYAQALQESFDDNKLNQALAEYERALEAKDKPAGAYIQEKVNLALGHVYVIQAQKTNEAELFTQAINHYSQVINQYEQTNNQGIRILAADAYFGLGAAYERQEDYTQAQHAYQRCIDLTNDPKLKTRAKNQLSIIEDQS